MRRKLQEKDGGGGMKMLLAFFCAMCTTKIYFLVCKKKKPVDFDGELKTGDVRYDNLTKITIKQQLFWRLRYEM